MIHSVSEIGDMVDFLKANPFMTINEYLWKYSIPMIKIMSIDNSHVNYLSEKEVERRKHVVNSGEKIKNESGIEIF